MHNDITSGQVLSVVEFARLRHRLWLTKTYGEDAFPHDPDADVLAGSHYTNLWRELDRGTIYLTNVVQEAGALEHDVVTNTVWYRLFNKIETNEALVKEFGSLRQAFTDPEQLFSYLSGREGNFTNAYIRCPSTERLCHEASTSELDEIADTVTAALGQLDWKAARRALGRVYSIGAFLGDQLMMDLTYLGGPVHQKLDLAPDDMFTPKFGPGARRGSDYCLETGQGGPEQVLDDLRQAFDDQPRPSTFAGVITYNQRELEHTLCEYQKHVRFAKSAGRAGSKVRKFSTVRDPHRLRVDRLPRGWTDMEVKNA